MKCPKCGYNSFEYYDNCIKCSNDLTGYKHTYSITSLVLPLIAKESMAAELLSAENVSDSNKDALESHEDIFSFDLPEDSLTAPVLHNDNPFDFDDPLPEINNKKNQQQEDDVFADLLESTSQVETSPLDTVTVVTKNKEAPSVPGEFDMENFSWDDSPAAVTPSGSKTDDDFDSLFGDTNGSAKK